MGFLKGVRLQAKAGSAVAEFATIKCKGSKVGETFYPCNFFMLFNFATGGMGGYYISPAGISENKTVGGSGGTIWMSPSISNDEITITLKSISSTAVPWILYDPANVTVIQLYYCNID